MRDAQTRDAWADVDEWGRLLPQGQELVTLANWQIAPHQRWAFQHMRELMPSQVIDGNDTLATCRSARWTSPTSSWRFRGHRPLAI